MVPGHIFTLHSLRNHFLSLMMFLSPVKGPGCYYNLNELYIGQRAKRSEQQCVS